MPVKIAAPALEAFIADVFATAGCSVAEAARIGHYLVAANLSGHDSHGVVRAPRYILALRAGEVVPDRSIEIVRESPVLAVVDGCNGFGQTVGPQAVGLGIAKARTMGLAAVALRNSGHIGRIGDWAEMAIASDLISVHFVNVAGSLLVAPFGGVERRISTAPFCVGVPRRGGKPPLLLDFATAAVAEGKVMVASRGGKKLPEGVLIEPDGRLTGDPATLYGPLDTPDRVPGRGTGAIRAFGEHKGSGLAFMCEILGGALTGGGTCGPLPEGATRGRRINNGMLSFYFSPAAFGAEDEFHAAADRYVEFFKSSRPATLGGEVLVPGEPEARSRAERLAEGVPLPDETWASILAAADQVGVPAARRPAA